MPAAGSASRFRGPRPKQYAALAGRTVIEWALAPFLADPRCVRIVVALAREDADWRSVAARLNADGGAAAAGSAVRLSAVPGGERRSESVRCALAALEAHVAPEDWILVHDAARPCLEAADLDRLLAQLATHPLGGLLAVPMTDTLKRAQREGAVDTVAQTIERADTWRALTPQMFRHARLCAALDQAHAGGRFPSDEAQALEWLGARPVLIAGAATNLKITTAEDLALAAAVLAARGATAPGAAARAGSGS